VFNGRASESIVEKRNSVTATKNVVSNVEDSGYLYDPEVQLMLRAKKGDDEAFSKLVVTYQDRLTTIFYHMTQNQEAAEDLAQDVFMRIYRARHGYQPNAKFSTWLFRIANNLAINAHRKKARRKEIVLPAGESTSMHAFGPGQQILSDKSSLTPTRQIDKRELQMVVQKAMDQLNERQRLTVLLHKFEGMSYAEIGETMELTVPAVKSLLSRARDSLRLALEPYMQMGKENH
jgi:RNA polymerase sigma-70 factor (ECF subfamily)